MENMDLVINHSFSFTRVVEERHFSKVLSTLKTCSSDLAEVQ